jgi:drug/metabolite transporter (DMT)-like permease
MDAVLGSRLRRRGTPRPSRAEISVGRASVPPTGVLVALFALYGCWGSSIPAMKLMVAGIPPLAGAGSVFLVGGAVLLFVSRRGPRPTREQTGRAAWVGVLMLVGGQGLGTVVLTKLTASLTALLVATVPLWMAALRIRRRERIDRHAVARLLVGFTGVLVVLLTAPASALGGSVLAVIACLAAAVFWALGSVRSADGETMPADPRIASAVELLTGGFVLLVLAALSGQLGPHTFSGTPASSLAAAGYLLFVDSLAGFALYAWLLRTAPLQLVASYGYVTPLVAAAIGIGVFGDEPWPGMVVGAILILVAVVAEIRGRGVGQSP